MAIKKLKDMKPGESGLIVALHGSFACTKC